MKKINEIISNHPFFKDFSHDQIDFISGCGKNAVFKPGETIAVAGSDADEFYLIREGKIGVYAVIPNRDNALIQTITRGDILGWSWLFPPYQWMFEAKALETTKVILFNGKCLRGKLENDPILGYTMMKRFASLLIHRLNATRLQLLDVYGKAK